MIDLIVATKIVHLNLLKQLGSKEEFIKNIKEEIENYKQMH
jgi:hypothetical protein